MNVLISLSDSVRCFSGQRTDVKIVMTQSGIITAGSIISITFGSSFLLQNTRAINISIRNNCSEESAKENQCDFAPVVSINQIQRVAGAFIATISLQDKIDYFSPAILVFIGEILNPIPGGLSEFLREGGVKIFSAQNQVMFQTSTATVVPLDPRRSNFVTFGLQDMRGLAATASIVNLTLQILPSRNLSSNGSLQLQIPAQLTYDTRSLKVSASDDSYLAQFGLEVQLLMSSSSLSRFSIQYSNASRRNNPQALLIAGVGVSLRIGPFRTPNVQPPLFLQPFSARSVSLTDFSRNLDSWDSPDSWGLLTDVGRVLESSIDCCTEIQLAHMGPVSALANLSVLTARAGAWSNISFQFVSSQQIPAFSFFLILLPSSFRTCSVGFCNPGDCTAYDCSPQKCIDQNLVVFNLELYTQVGVLNTTMMPSRVWRCGSSASDILGSQCAALPSDCTSSSSFVGSNAVAFTTSAIIEAGFRIVVNTGGILMPRTIVPVGIFSLNIQFPGNPMISSPWTQGVIDPGGVILPSMIPEQNAFIAPQDRTVGLSTSYSIFILSSTGMATDGWIEVSFPEGTTFSDLKIAGAAFSGSIASTGYALADTVYLQSPASTQNNFYGNKQIHLLPRQCAIDVQQTLVSSPSAVPKVVVWQKEYSSWTSWFFSSFCFKVAQAVTALVSSPYVSTFPPQKVSITVGDSRYIDSNDFSSFAISNLNSRMQVTRIGDSTIRIGSPTCANDQSCFLFPFPAQGLINLTVSGIVNSPLSKVSTDPYKIQLFSPDGNTLEVAEKVPGTILIARNIAAEIILDTYGAHDRTGCIVIISIDSQIQAGSTIEVKFADWISMQNDPRNGFSGAETLQNVSGVVLSDQFLANISSSVLLTPTTQHRFMYVNASLLVTSPSSCTWNRSKAENDSLVKECAEISATTVKILLESFVPASSIIALRIQGALRNPARPGRYIWPLDAVRVLQWDATVSKSQKTLTADASDANSPAQITLKTSGLATLTVDITSGKLAEPKVLYSNPYVGGRTNVQFIFRTESGIMSSDSIFIAVPKIFSAASTSTQDLPGLSILGRVQGLPGNLAVSSVSKILGSSRTSILVKLSRSSGTDDCSNSMTNTGIDQVVSFTLGPFISRDSASENIYGREEEGNLFGVFVVDENSTLVEGSENDITVFPPDWSRFVGSFPAPSIRPNILDVKFNSTSSRSASISNISFMFNTFSRAVNGSEFFLFLPNRFSVAGTPGCSIHKYVQNTSEWNKIRIGPVQKEPIYLGFYLDSIALRVQVLSEIVAGTMLVLEYSNIQYPMGGAGSYSSNFTIASSMGCSGISASDCFWLVDVGIAREPRILPGIIKETEVKMSSVKAGNQVMLEFKMLTSNPFPPLGMVEIILPDGYMALPGLLYCSIILSVDNICQKPCTGEERKYCPLGLVINSSSFSSSLNGSRIYLKSWNLQALYSISSMPVFPNWTFVLNPAIYPNQVHLPGLDGVSLAFNVSSVRLRQSPGPPGLFVIRTKDSSGNVVDETSLGFPSSSGPLLPNKLLSTLVQPLSLAARASTAVIIQFVTTNPIPPGGMVCVSFPVDFEISSCEILPGQSSMYAVSFITGQKVCIKDVMGKAARSFSRIFLGKVVNAGDIGATTDFQINTTDAYERTIDYDPRVLYQILVPSVLSDTAVTPLNSRASANSDVVVEFTSPTESSGDIAISFPPGYDIKPFSILPIKEIKYENHVLCSFDSMTTCLNATTLPLPPISINVLGTFPVSGYSDENYVVTVFGTDFGKSSKAKFGSSSIPVKFVSSSVIEIEINCKASQSLMRPLACDFLEYEALIESRICESRSASTVLGPVNSIFCSPEICNNRSNVSTHCQSTPVTIVVPLTVSLDGILFTNSSFFTLYRRISDSCPNQCGEGNRAGVCKRNECECKYPFGGIDCGVGPIALKLVPNFGPSSGKLFYLYEILTFIFMQT